LNVDIKWDEPMRHWGDFVVENISTHGPIVIGIDPVSANIPSVFRSGGRSDADAMERSVAFILDALCKHARFVKFQSAFFEAGGSAGIAVLSRSIQHARKLGFGVILDAKRGDIGSTAAAYARAYLTPDGSDLEADCITVNPYLGPDTLEPFFACCSRYGKGVLVLAKTSNPGSGWLQDKMVDQATVSDHVAILVRAEDARNCGASGVSNVGAVVGATYVEDGLRLRALMPNAIFLMPGIGPQGGDIKLIARLRESNTGAVLVPVSRGLTFVEDLSISEEGYGSLLRERFCRLTSQV
jgi:orotidine-5'-phosphate decarboxylase